MAENLYWGGDRWIVGDNQLQNIFKQYESWCKNHDQDSILDSLEHPDWKKILVASHYAKEFEKELSDYTKNMQ